MTVKYATDFCKKKNGTFSEQRDFCDQHSTTAFLDFSLMAESISQTVPFGNVESSRKAVLELVELDLQVMTTWF